MGKMMDIKFRSDEEMFTELQDLMNGIGQNALYMSHYELAEEMDLLKRAKVSTMLSTVDTNKNTGQAQLLNTLLNQTKNTNRKEGPVFIYTHIPLNNQEEHAPNVATNITDKSNS